ncbi:MAG: accessory factor UbiK family protein [Rhodospirillaceae bacterium]
MQTSNRFLDDLAKVANGAVATASGLKKEMDAMIRQQLERLMYEADMVHRDEFEAVAEVARNARAEQEKLEARVAALERALKMKPAAAKAKPAAGRAKSAADKPAGKTKPGKK